MSFFSDERAGELRAIFFETAQELVQAMNEEGLHLEQAPADREIVRELRRTVHTLKGDAAACGYEQLSDLAHKLEDALTPETAERAGTALAEVVLRAADSFEACLAAYRSATEPPSTDELRQMVQQLIAAAPASAGAPPAAKGSSAGSHAGAADKTFHWTEYERLAIAKGTTPESTVFNLELVIEPNCAMPAAALQVIWRTLDDLGAVLASHPARGLDEPVLLVEAALATTHPVELVENRCRIPGIVSAVRISPHRPEGKATPAAAEQPLKAGAAQGKESGSELSHAPAATPSAAHPVAGERPKTERIPATDNLLRVEVERVDTVLDLLGELIISKSTLQQVLADFGRQNRKDPMRIRLSDALAKQAQAIQGLQRAVMKIRMVPVEQLFRRFPRMIRDVAKLRQKEAQLVVKGEHTDLDKRILDALAEPLTHLLRNAVDHGIEAPDVRLRAGKSASGTISLQAYHQGSHIVIEVTDDGAGMDHEAILEKAVDQGIIGEDEAGKISPRDALRLTLEPGFSTAETVTEISGRGVGLDVVKSTVERLKGSVSIDTTIGGGTTFTLELPLTLAIIKAMLFSASAPSTALAGNHGAGDQLYAVPLGNVLEITRAFESQVHLLEGYEVLRLREEVIPLIRMESGAPKPTGKIFVIVVSVADRKFGLVVERLKGEEELVIKALDDELIATEMVSGASVLGDGRVVLVLNLAEMVERFCDRQSFGRKAAQA